MSHSTIVKFSLSDISYVRYRECHIKTIGNRSTEAKYAESRDCATIYFLAYIELKWESTCRSLLFCSWNDMTPVIEEATLIATMLEKRIHSPHIFHVSLIVTLHLLTLTVLGPSSVILHSMKCQKTFSPSLWMMVTQND